MALTSPSRVSPSRRKNLPHVQLGEGNHMNKYEKYIAIIIIIMSELIKLVHEAVKCKNISLIKWICQCIHLIHGKRYKAHSWTLVAGWCSIVKPPLQVCTNHCSYFRTTPKIFTNLYFYFQTTFQECTNLSIFLHGAFKPKKKCIFGMQKVCICTYNLGISPEAHENS